MKNKPNEIELYAKDCLHFYVENSERYEYKDKPDFQNIQDNIGIEVCYSILKREAECEDVLKKIADLSYSKSRAFLNDYCKKRKLDLWDCGNEKKALSPYEGMIEFDVHINNTSKIILKKIQQKLKNYSFKTMGLFVKLRYLFSQEDVQKVFEKLNEELSVADRHFDFYILDCSDFGYKCQYKDGSLLIKFVLKNKETILKL